MTVAGISSVIATAALASIGDISRFQRPEKLASYFGLKPRIRQSGARGAIHGRIGILLIVAGGLTVFGLGRRGAAGDIGIGAIIIGLVLLIWPEETARFSFALLGGLALLIGIGSLLTSRQLSETDHERLAARNAGFAGLLIGLFLIFWPGTGLVALGWAIAFRALTISVMMFLLASRFKGANERLKRKVINPR